MEGEKGKLSAIAARRARVWRVWRRRSGAQHVQKTKDANPAPSSSAYSIRARIAQAKQRCTPAWVCEKQQRARRIYVASSSRIFVLVTAGITRRASAQRVQHHILPANQYPRIERRQCAEDGGRDGGGSSELECESVVFVAWTRMKTALSGNWDGRGGDAEGGGDAELEGNGIAEQKTRRGAWEARVEGDAVAGQQRGNVARYEARCMYMSPRLTARDDEVGKSMVERREAARRSAPLPPLSQHRRAAPYVVYRIGGHRRIRTRNRIRRARSPETCALVGCKRQDASSLGVRPPILRAPIHPYTINSSSTPALEGTSPALECAHPHLQRHCFVASRRDAYWDKRAQAYWGAG
ncbi:hypothetical protein MSAN_00630300 [Mycena sanguinolenta]|uniref:Uncharacterized protein n=1 Tax=Mycena sanguinolenta TaxID=230812 RepID=A0A8H7DF77_9AGAR|nr:hypothetical protein MSAN_00630300 [Mycena sanguinolenta]